MERKFRQTDLGLFPDNWEIVSLKDIGHFSKGRGISRSDSCSGNIPAVRYGEIYTVHNDYIKDFYSHINHDVAQTATKLKFGDILFTASGETKEDIGKAVAFISPDIEAYAGGDTIILSPNRNVNSMFLGYLLNTPLVVKQRASKAQGDAIVHITTDSVKSIYVVLPPISEQEQIAKVLSDIDDLINELTSLIAKKQAIRLGSMQQLLTGKIRLKGFSEPWDNKQLGRIGFTFSGLTGKTKADFGRGNAKYITFLNVLNNPILKSELFEEVVVKEGERQNNCHKGDLFFNTSSETPEEVGICAMLDSEMDSLYLNSFCFGYRLTDKNIVPAYLAYYFRSNEGRKLMTVLAQGVTRYNLSKSEFNKAEIFMPVSNSEQKAIADVLMCMDNEISALEAKKAKYESIKRGMMQDLLTGKIRLV